MSFTREYEIARPAVLPKWVRDFADEQLKKGGSSFEDIKNIFKQEEETVEAKVEDIRERVGLDMVVNKIASEDNIEGGLADGQPDEKYDEEQLDKGIVVEMEHTSNPDIAKEIVKDHLEESQDFEDEEDAGKYYDKLEELEKKI